MLYLDLTSDPSSSAKERDFATTSSRTNSRRESRARGASRDPTRSSQPTKFNSLRRHNSPQRKPRERAISPSQHGLAPVPALLAVASLQHLILPQRPSRRRRHQGKKQQHEQSKKEKPFGAKPARRKGEENRDNDKGMRRDVPPFQGRCSPLFRLHASQRAAIMVEMARLRSERACF